MALMHKLREDFFLEREVLLGLGCFAVSLGRFGARLVVVFLGMAAMRDDVRVSM